MDTVEPTIARIRRRRARYEFSPDPEATRRYQNRLLSTSRKVRQLERAGIRVVQRVPCQPDVQKFAALSTNEKAKMDICWMELR